jgi:GT2 family glycosyltransferase
MPTLLTVGLPVYNAMPYLKETVESLFSQTVGDFQILAVVGNCKDGSIEYLESLRDSRLRIVREQKPGLIPALNQMLHSIETPWLVRQDADDVSYPRRIERLLQYIQRFPEAGMFYSLADYHPKSRSVGRFRCTRGTPEELRAIAKAGYLLSFCHTSVALNKVKTLAVGGYREESHTEDADLWWRMALETEIRFIPEPLVGFRQNEASRTARNLVGQHVEALYVQYCLLSHLWSRKAEPLERVSPVLETLLSQRDLRANEALRGFNMQLAEGRRIAAVFELLRCCALSPRYLVRRLGDEFWRTAPITNGIAPQKYLERKEDLWQRTDAELYASS